MKHIMTYGRHGYVKDTYHTLIGYRSCDSVHVRRSVRLYIKYDITSSP